jgi:hypothetical protein
MSRGSGTTNTQYEPYSVTAHGSLGVGHTLPTLSVTGYCAQWPFPCLWHLSAFFLLLIPAGSPSFSPVFICCSSFNNVEKRCICDHRKLESRR